MEKKAPTKTLSGDESLVLPEFDTPLEDPIELLHRWLTIAADHDVREPLAVSLATADEHGRPVNRIVLIKEITNCAIVFTSHTSGRKGRHIAVNPFAAMNFYWRETLQQITVSGPVEPLPAEKSDELFAERPVAAQATTAVSAQSTPLHDEQSLHTRAQELTDANEPLPRPAGWGGYRLVPDTIEFWQGKSTRLHRRLQYTRTGNDWSHVRLQP
ncbi:phenazine biosynthesis FMN-dependent oxidase PhzG [Saccharopolyspora pogona]|uniref:phenazine biosynthesis FMN-dependent oxidase PhzG n=1 Tax=Saccharopolyspora pogona TaxID=333966 RepID=UPI001688B34C|nr:phenazine biosynthesis FMN-dependent oxidase PhzG [Saccharopolyspora pogona]